MPPKDGRCPQQRPLHGRVLLQHPEKQCYSVQELKDDDRLSLLFAVHSPRGHMTHHGKTMRLQTEDLVNATGLSLGCWAGLWANLR